MDKLEFLRQSKTFLRKVRDQRRHLLRHHEGKPSNIRMINMIREIDFWLPYIISFDGMLHFLCLQKNRERILELIPSNKPGWVDEYNNLLRQGWQLKYGRQLDLAL